MKKNHIREIVVGFARFSRHHSPDQKQLKNLTKTHANFPEQFSKLSPLPLNFVKRAANFPAPYLQRR